MSWLRRRVIAVLVLVASIGCGRDSLWQPSAGAGGGGGDVGGGSDGGVGGDGGGTGGGVGGGTGGGVGGGPGGGVGGGTGGGGGGSGVGGGGGADVNVPCDLPAQAPTLPELITGMTHSWKGIAHTPWVPDYEVKITFNPDGTYSTSCDSNCVAFYYGTDGSDPRKKWTLTDVHTNGEGAGDIEIIWPQSTFNEGNLDGIRICASGQRLDFVFFPSWLGHLGPLEYHLALVQ